MRGECTGRVFPADFSRCLVHVGSSPLRCLSALQHTESSHTPLGHHALSPHLALSAPSAQPHCSPSSPVRAWSWSPGSWPQSGSLAGGVPRFCPCQAAAQRALAASSLLRKMQARRKRMEVGGKGISSSGRLLGEQGEHVGGLGVASGKDGETPGASRGLEYPHPHHPPLGWSSVGLGKPVVRRPEF